MNILDFGTTTDGQNAQLYVLKNDTMECRVTDFGTILVNLFVPDKNGTPIDIVLGYNNVIKYEKDTQSLGCNVGRIANRIRGASFTLNDTVYTLDKNEGENNLHSGFHPYSKRIWAVENYNDTSITFSLESPDMDQGFPGAIKMHVTYKLSDNRLLITYEGTPDKDTIINMTNHSYFNLNGQGNGDILEHTVLLHASRFTPSDPALIPTGDILPVADTPMDFTRTKAIGRDIHEKYDQLLQGLGYDHNYCIDDYDGTTRTAVWVDSDQAGIHMEIATNYPGVQMYTANYLKDIPGKDGKIYQPYEAVCFEPQFYPDAINQPAFVSPICKAGDKFSREIQYTFTH
ncbi:MAG: galactose mutarotase [Clostridiales bacterium]|nr:galactose mutarotase [Clostridiales bacterium]